MEIYKNKGKSKNACSYCRQTGHNVASCKLAEYDWNEWSMGRVPLDSETLQTNAGWWYKENYTHWYRNSRAAYRKIEAARHKAKQNQPRRKTKCGFCGEQGHTRRTCAVMAQVLKDAYQANENWRRAFYQRMVVEEGLSEGAAVRVDRARHSYWSRNTHKPEYAMGLISSVNWDDLSFLSSHGHISSDYRTDLRVTAVVDGKTVDVIFKKWFERPDGKVVCAETKSWLYGPSYDSIVGKSEKPLSEEWASEGMKDEILFLLKKRNLEKLKEAGIMDAIDAWKDQSC